MLHVLHRVEAAVVADLLRGPQAAEQRDRLVGAPASLLDRDLAGAELRRVLAADADAEHESTAAGVVEVGDLLGDDRRRIQRQEQDRRADPARVR